MKSPSLTFYGGVGEIGGNKILLEDMTPGFFFDFGAGFSDGKDYFCGLSNGKTGIWPRNTAINGAGDYFEFGLLPEIPGLYSEEALRNTELEYGPPE